jgi:hypothetical protein
LWERVRPTGTDWGRRVIDDWKEKLRCPKCRKTAMASLCQAEGDDTPTVEFVPDGFRVVKTNSGPDFQCATCDVAVEP